MSQARAERLVNLALCLMSSDSRLWTADEIRRTVPGYDHTYSPDGDVAYRRAFERDKEELRSLGFPVLTATGWTGVEGYRIPRQDAFLPEVRLSPDEVRAVALAVRVWRSGSLAQAAATAWTKLRAAGAVLPDAAADGPGAGMSAPFADIDVGPGQNAGEPSFDPLLAALRDGRAVTFDYRSGGGPQARRRTVEPWGLRAVRGRWYLLGRDRDKQATRVFRLSRIAGAVRAIGVGGAVRRPADLDLAAEVARLSGEGSGPVRIATVRLRPGRAAGVRRLATAVRTVGDDVGDEGVALAEVPFREVDRAAQMFAGFGADAVVLEPADLREAVLTLLRQAAAASVATPADPAAPGGVAGPTAVAGVAEGVRP